MNTNLKRYMHPNVHSSIIYNSQDMEAIHVSINRRMDKEDVAYIFSGILLSHKKEWNFATTWMDLEGITLSEISEKDKYCTLSLICII